MTDQVFIYWDDWKQEIIKKEIPDNESLRFSKKPSQEKETPEICR
jgi:hypothetical protein